jgi:hypothetical protein
MTEKEIDQLIDLTKKQLTLLNLYPEHFEERLGNKGVEDYVNERLDRLIRLQNLRNQWKQK